MSVDRRAAAMHTESVEIPVSERIGAVSALLAVPDDAAAMFVLAHGAGAGMRHPFLEEVARALFDDGVATLRYQFPYMDAKRGRPDPPAILERTVRAAVEAASRRAQALPLFAGGKSMGGRMTSQAAAAEALPGVRGIVFLGFPLHAPGRPGTARADHLSRVTVPMLFVQGTRDDFAGLDLLRPVCDELGERATLHVVDGGDHSFRVLKRSGRTGEDVMNEIGRTVSGWIQTVVR